MFQLREYVRIKNNTAPNSGIVRHKHVDHTHSFIVISYPKMLFLS